MRRRVATAAAPLALLLAGCRNTQSVLSPQSEDAERYATLAWVMIAGGTIIFVLVLAALALSFAGPRRVRFFLAREATVIGAGIVFPAVVLAALLAYGTVLTASGTATRSAGDAVRITVVGEQWWWRVVYSGAAGGREVHSANEIRIPAGRPVEIALQTADVIHSFWVPELGGKTDMIPGRTNIMRIAAKAPGVARGQCAEYCGGAHARMSLAVVALSDADHALWLQRERAPAAPPQTDLARRGLDLFLTRGCGGCHTVRGTPAAGVIGPDLTHVASRRALAAETLPNTKAAMVRWIRDNQRIKPGNRMLAYDGLAEAELDAIAEYLMGLE